MVASQWQYARRRLLGEVFVGRDFLRERGYRFRDLASSGDMPVITGKIAHIALAPGIGLHCVEGQDLYNDLSSKPIEPGMRIVVVLDGRVRVAFGGKWLVLDTTSAHGRPKPRAAVIGIGQCTTFEREWQHGKHERKVSISLTWQWLLQHGFNPDAVKDGLAQFMQQDVGMHEWMLSGRIVSLAEKILDHCKETSLSSRMLLLASAYEIIQEALVSIEQMKSTDAPMVLHRYQKIHKVRDFLGDEAYMQLTVSEIAKIVALSQSTLQRQFKAVFGVSVDTYRRQARLKVARYLLEKEGLSVGQVADTVGYTSAANFSTAFKRQYGVLPKAVRSRL